MKQYFVGGGNLFAQEAGRILLVYEWSNKRKRRFPQYWNKFTLLGSIYRKRMPYLLFIMNRYGILFITETGSCQLIFKSHGVGEAAWFRTTIFVGLAGHIKNQFTTILNRGMFQKVFIVRFAIQCYIVYINVLF